MNPAPHQRLLQVIAAAHERLLPLSEATVSTKPAPNKWSPKEIVGHLIDSATHNQQRFVRAQLQDNLIFPGYEQEEWVAIQQYQQREWQELLALWCALNVHIARIMAATPESVLHRAHQEHSFRPISFVPGSFAETATIRDFMVDYVDHLEHHLRQILPDFTAAGAEHSR